MAASDLHPDLRTLDTVGVVSCLFSVLALFIFEAQSRVAEEFEVMNDTPNQGAAANGLSAVRSSVAGVRERIVRSTAAPEAVAELDR